MGNDAISGIGKIDRNDKPAVNKIQFGNGFNNFMNRLRSGEPIIGNLLNNNNAQSTQQAFRN